MAGHRRKRDAELLLIEQYRHSRRMFDDRVQAAKEIGDVRDIVSAANQYARAALARAEKTHPLHAQQVALQCADAVSRLTDHLYSTVIKERRKAR